LSFNFILSGFDHILLEVLMAVLPIMILFLFFIIYFKLPKEMLLNLLKGIILAFAGLSLFLQGVNIGFIPVAGEMGSVIGAMANRWILIPIGFILGFVATLAEPAVRILCRQVEKSSSGYIRGFIVMYTLCLAVGLFIALGMTRIVYGIPFYYLIIPGYILAIILMFLSKPSFTAIAFDSGGVATGPMTVTFIMALAIGAADVIEGRDSVADGFGLIALVALAPIIMIMLLGFLYPDDNQEAKKNNADNDIDLQDNHDSADVLTPDQDYPGEHSENELYNNQNDEDNEEVNSDENNS